MSLPLPASLSQSPLLPGLVFLAEVTVVTLGTLRTMYVAQGKKYLAPLLGIAEVSIWLFAIGQIMQNAARLDCYLAFAGGFTLGTYFGIQIEQQLALGQLAVRVITNRNADVLVGSLRSAHYGVTTLDGRGATGAVQVVVTIIKRKELENVLAVIERSCPNAFYSVDELRAASRGVFPPRSGPVLEVQRWRTPAPDSFRRSTETVGPAVPAPRPSSKD